MTKPCPGRECFEVTTAKIRIAATQLAARFEAISVNTELNDPHKLYSQGDTAINDFMKVAKLCCDDLRTGLGEVQVKMREQNGDRAA